MTNDASGISSDVRDKLIWKCFRYDPKPEDLARAIIVPKLTQVAEALDFDVEECVCHASKVAGCTNARAMIKATKLLAMAFGSRAARDPQVDKGNRQSALCDFVRFSLLAAMGEAPLRPTKRQEGADFDLEHARMIQLFNQYSQLDVIDAFFDSKRSVTREDVQKCLTSYVATRYAGTPETMRLRRILEDMRDVQHMEDQGVASLAAGLSHCIMHTEFDLSYLGEAIRANWTLRNWGFEEAISPDNLLRRAKKLVDSNPRDAYRGIHGEYLHWSDEWENRYDGLMDALDAYAVEAYARFVHEELIPHVNRDDSEAGKTLADFIEERWTRDEDRFLDFSPSLVASLFANGDAASQIALYRVFMGLKDRAVFSKDERAKQWALSLLAEMKNAEPKSRMGGVRSR